MHSSSQQSIIIQLIIPAFNEEAAIGAVVRSFQSLELPDPLSLQIMVVDNGSSDRTAQVAAAAGAQVVSELARGYGAACYKGITCAAAAVDILVFADGDGSDMPEDLPRLVTPLLEGKADLVVGTRTASVASARVLTLPQRFGNRLATRLLSLRYGVSLTDLGPFRAIRKATLQQLDLRDRGYGWTVEMELRALQRGLQILEVPVGYRRRIAGKSKISGTVTGCFGAGCVILSIIGRAFLNFERAQKHGCNKHS